MFFEHMSIHHAHKREAKMDVEEEEEEQEESEDDGYTTKKKRTYNNKQEEDSLDGNIESDEEKLDEPNIKRQRYDYVHNNDNNNNYPEEEGVYYQEDNLLIGNEEKDEMYADDEEIQQPKKKKQVRRDIPMTIIVLCDAPTGAIGVGDTEFPWRQVPPEASEYVARKVKQRKDKTKRNAVIVGNTLFTEVMGKKQYPNCLTAVLSRTFSLYGRDLNWFVTAPSISRLYRQICKFDDVEHIYVLGGARTFREAMKRYCNDMYVMFYRPVDRKMILRDYDHRIVFKDKYEEIDVDDREDLASGLKLTHFVRKPEIEPEEYEDL